jgi:hypothetical protein
MKTQTTYPRRKAQRAILGIAAILFFVQFALFAGDSASVKKEISAAANANVEYTESSQVAAAGNTPCFFLEEAVETELEIETWMSNIQNEFLFASNDEEEIELEEWMANPDDSFWLGFYTADEPELVIEDWMTTPDEWFVSDGEVMLTAK